MIPTDSRVVTRDMQRLNPGLLLSRATDTAARNSPDRAAIEGLLVQISYAIWEIRTGETSCNDINHMMKNVTKLTRRTNLARNVTVRGSASPGDITYIQEYCGYLERYYVRMYAQELRDELFEQVQGSAIYDRLAYPLMMPPQNQYSEIGRIMNIEGGLRPVLRESSVGRGRSRSR